jgi:hypothetical protein
VFVLNDAHAALMAESSFGAGKGLMNMVLLTLGTGVGGGILINGEVIYRHRVLWRATWGTSPLTLPLMRPASPVLLAHLSRRSATQQ